MRTELATGLLASSQVKPAGADCVATQIVSVIKAAGVQKLDEATSAADVSHYIGSLGTEIRAAVGAHCPGLPGS